MTVDRTFLSRWSRLKRKEASPEAPEPNDAPVSQGAGGTDETDDAEITPEELAALPPVESILGDTDVAAFLRRGVPAALRNAALRRAWALDPQIREYVDPARDYAYDWNVPGGVPGSGPLDPGEGVGVVERLFPTDGAPAPSAVGAPVETSGAGATGVGAVAPNRAHPGPPEAPRPRTGAIARDAGGSGDLQEGRLPDAARHSPPVRSAAPGEAASQANGPPSEQPPGPARHGRATPV